MLSVLMCLVFVQDYSGDAKLPLPLQPPLSNTMRAESVALFADDPGRRHLGKLTYLEGVVLHEQGRGIGGWSALSVVGRRVTMVSDGGSVVSFDWLGGERLARVRYSSLIEGPGHGWSKLDRDSESLARDPKTGRYWVGFERANAIWRYQPDLAHATGHVRPEAMRRWEENGGPESLARLSDGRFVTIAETRGDGKAGLRHGIVFMGDPVEPATRQFAFSYRPPAGTHPVDAAELPDGRLVVLNRGVGLPNGFWNVLVVIDRGAIRPGAEVSGREIARLEAPALHDNFEGVAVTREGGRTILWLVSDDNQFILQRTLLLKFALED